MRLRGANVRFAFFFRSAGRAEKSSFLLAFQFFSALTFWRTIWRMWHIRTLLHWRDWKYPLNRHLLSSSQSFRRSHNILSIDFPFYCLQLAAAAAASSHFYGGKQIVCVSRDVRLSLPLALVHKIYGGEIKWSSHFHPFSEKNRDQPECMFVIRAGRMKLIVIHALIVCVQATNLADPM